MELKKLLESKTGDILVLDDFNALEAIGKALEAEIKAVNHYEIDDHPLSYTTFEISHENLTMRLVVKTVGGFDEIRMFTTFDEGSFYEFLDNYPNDSEDQDDGLPTGFILDPANGDEENEYLADDPFPIYGIIKDGTIPCAIGEYTYNGEADSTYCSKYALLEWYISSDPDSDDHDNYYSIAFGWDVDLNDINVLQG